MNKKELEQLESLLYRFLREEIERQDLEGLKGSDLETWLEGLSLKDLTQEIDKQLSK
jgi:hypothetical protein